MSEINGVADGYEFTVPVIVIRLHYYIPTYDGRITPRAQSRVDETHMQVKAWFLVVLSPPVLWGNTVLYRVLPPRGRRR